MYILIYENNLITHLSRDLNTPQSTNCKHYDQSDKITFCFRPGTFFNSFVDETRNHGHKGRSKKKITVDI